MKNTCNSCGITLFPVVNKVEVIAAVGSEITIHTLEWRAAAAVSCFGVEHLDANIGNFFSLL